MCRKKLLTLYNYGVAIFWQLLHLRGNPLTVLWHFWQQPQFGLRGEPFTIFAIFLWCDHILAVASPERGALSPPLSWSIRDTKTGGGGGGARRGEGEGAKGGGQQLQNVALKGFIF